jgi:hypothetical protein
MAITQTYVDYGAGNDATGDGTIGTPWKTLQWAFDHLPRNTTDGNQVNLKAGTAHVNGAALDLTTFLVGGSLTAVRPLIVRGYTSAANDGGIGEIDCGGATLWAAATYDYIVLADLVVHTFGDNNGIALDTYCNLYGCSVHKGASSPSGKTLVALGVGSSVVGCHLYDQGAGASSAVITSYGGVIAGNHIVMDADSTGFAVYVVDFKVVVGNIIVCTKTDQFGIGMSGTGYAVGNIIRNSTAGTNYGIGLIDNNPTNVIQNNIIIGWSGAGGKAVSAGLNVNAGVIGHNAFYNNTTNYSIADQRWVDLTANDVTLAADPFTDAANGDFSLTAAAKTALAAKGWPASYLGAHANTVPNLNIGPIQMAASSGGGGGPVIGSRIIRGLGAI